MNTINSKPKIAILTIKNSYKYGGVLTCVSQVYKFCQKYFDPTVFVLSFEPELSTSLKSLKFDSHVRTGSYFDMNCVEIGARWAFWEPGHYVYTLSAWKDVLSGYKYFFVKSGSGICAYPLIQLNKKFVLWIGTSYQDDRAERIKELSWSRSLVDKLAAFQMRKMEEEILEESDFLLTISKNTRKRVEQILGRQRSNLLVCNYPVNSKREILVENNKTEKMVLAVGRFSDPRKNVEMLLRVFEKMYKKMPELKLCIVGKKPSDEKLEHFSKNESFKNITFVGEVEPEKLGQYYQSASLVLLTSYQEGLGIAGLEALSYGVPVVATDCGGTRDYVVDGLSGFLVQINDDECMSSKALEILSSQDLHNKMRDFSLNFAEENFSEAKIYSIFKIALSKVYPELKNVFEQQDLGQGLVQEKAGEQSLNL